MESVKRWIELGPSWAVEVLEALSLERGYRELEHNCYRSIKQ